MQKFMILKNYFSVYITESQLCKPSVKTAYDPIQDRVGDKNSRGWHCKSRYEVRLLWYEQGIT